MLNRNKILVALLASSTVLINTSLNAAETVNATASVTVQNAFELVESAQLSFGTITFAKGAGTPTTQPTILLSTQGGSSPTNSTGGTTQAKVSTITTGTPATFDIANASPFTNLSVTISVLSTDKLSNASAGSGNGKFSLKEFDFREVGESADIEGVANSTSTSGSITTLLDGTSSFAVGATLVADAEKDYIDGVYSGSYTVKVSY
jgi:hypothetical protein